MDLNKIISEEIDKFINEDVFAEKKKHAGKSKMDAKKSGPKDVYKKAKKLKNGLRTDYNAKRDRQTNPNLNNQDAEDLSTLIDSDFVNTAAVAHELYPGHTPEGAQSQLRKKVKGIENDNGSKYKLKKREADKIRKIIAKELH